jgi:hypothetical protein
LHSEVSPEVPIEDKVIAVAHGVEPETHAALVDEAAPLVEEKEVPAASEDKQRGAGVQHGGCTIGSWWQAAGIGGMHKGPSRCAKQAGPL